MVGMPVERRTPIGQMGEEWGGQLAGREKSIVRVNDAKQWTLCR